MATETLLSFTTACEQTVLYRWDERRCYDKITKPKMDVYLIRSELAYLRVVSESLWGAVLTMKMGASSW